MLLTIPALLLFLLPGEVIKQKNRNNLGFNGKNLMHDSNFKGLVSYFFAIKTNGYVQNKVRNPVPADLAEMLKVEMTGDLRNILINLDRVHFDSGTRNGEWGFNFIWALYKSIFKTFKISSPAVFKSKVDSLIRFSTFCSNNRKFNCRKLGREFHSTF